MDGITALLNDLFDDVCEHLNADSLNYHVDIRLYRSHGTAGTSVGEIVKGALGERAVLGGTYPASAKEIVDEVILSLRFEGDRGSHPDLAYLTSVSGHRALEEIARMLDEFVRQSDNVIGFWLKDGHPFYPVFWDYAYAIEGKHDAYLLIGSSSD